MIADDIAAFVVTPSHFNNVYALTRQHMLRRWEAGSVWFDLSFRSPRVKSLKLDPDGTMRAVGIHGEKWSFAPTYVGPILDPVEVGQILCLGEPTADEVLQAAHLRESDVLSIVVESIVDQADPFRLFPLEGPADHIFDANIFFPMVDFPERAHHCHFQVTIYFSASGRQGRSPLVLFLDRDKVIRVGGFEIENYLLPDRADCAHIQPCNMK